MVTSDKLGDDTEIAPLPLLRDGGDGTAGGGGTEVEEEKDMLVLMLNIDSLYTVVIMLQYREGRGW
jgi:hypothetical protein